MKGRLLRLLRHRWLEDGLRGQVTDAMMSRFEAQVEESERGHRGEIRLCIEAALPNSYLWRRATARERAVALFGKLGVWDTEENNGVLVYVLLAEHAIELVADRGVARYVEPAAWAEVVGHMSAALRADRFEEGITQALAEVHDLLVRHYPAVPGRADVDELPNRPRLD